MTFSWYDTCYMLTRNLSGDEIANVNFLYDDISHTCTTKYNTRALVPPQVDAVMC